MMSGVILPALSFMTNTAGDERGGGDDRWGDSSGGGGSGGGSGKG